MQKKFLRTYSCIAMSTITILGCLPQISSAMLTVTEADQAGARQSRPHRGFWQTMMQEKVSASGAGNSQLMDKDVSACRECDECMTFVKPSGTAQSRWENSHMSICRTYVATLAATAQEAALVREARTEQADREWLRRQVRQLEAGVAEATRRTTMVEQRALARAKTLEAELAAAQQQKATLEAIVESKEKSPQGSPKRTRTTSAKPRK